MFSSDQGRISLIVMDATVFLFDDDDDDELNNLYSAITLDSREYYTSRSLTTTEKKFETSIS